MSYYNMVRISIFIVLATICIFIINTKVHYNLRKTSIIASLFCCAILTFTVLELVPFENSILTFETPEEAFDYYKTEAIDVLIEGEDSCLIVAKNDSAAQQVLIFKKNKNDWDIKTGLSVNKTNFTKTDDAFLSILSIDGSADKYVEIDNILSKELTVSDNINSEFHKAENGKYYAYIEDFSNNYVININGDSAVFGN